MWLDAPHEVSSSGS